MARQICHILYERIYKAISIYFMSTQIYHDNFIQVKKDEKLVTNLLIKDKLKEIMLSNYTQQEILEFI